MNWVDFGGGIFLVNHQFGVASVAIICPDHITVFKKIEAGTSTMLIFQRFFGGISFQGFPCLGSVRTLSGLCFGIGEMENHGKLWMRWNTIINTSGCFSIFWKMNDHVYVYRANLYIHIYRACSTVSLYIYICVCVLYIYIYIYLDTYIFIDVDFGYGLCKEVSLPNATTKRIAWNSNSEEHRSDRLCWIEWRDAWSRDYGEISLLKT